MRHAGACFVLILVLTCFSLSQAGVGDPQLRTDHPWYPGELACSTFERLQETQAIAFQKVTGHLPQSDEDRALAAWMWRNIHYAHGEEGAQDLWGKGFQSGNCTTRNYWTGMFAHGFGLCGTTHAQWTAELNAILGHGRSRTVGVVGHNALEVFLKGGAYQDGRWVLLDHDISTVVFDSAGERLLSIDEIGKDLSRIANPEFQPERQRGWPLGGLHQNDPQAYAEFNVVEHLPGYAGPPPRVHLRKGETLRRYYQPGLEDGNTFVFWGRNYRANGIAGLERSRTWVNQPERFRGSPKGSGYQQGQARYGNAVYTYKPDFQSDAYKEGVIQETEMEVILDFQTPYLIAATPPDDTDWGVYKTGARNGLQVRTRNAIPVSVSVDHGGSWHLAKYENGQADLTDFSKGSQQYWLKFEKSAQELASENLEIVTVCQANPAMFPRLKPNGTTVNFAATGLGLTSAGPTVPHAEQHVIAGAFNTPRVTLELTPPRNRAASHLYAAAHIASSNPPDPEVLYQIEYSTDHGSTWKPVVKDWHIVRQGNEPSDFWSQSFCYGDTAIDSDVPSSVQVRFRNNGGKKYLRCETHLAYPIQNQESCKITFAWTEAGGKERIATKIADSETPTEWQIETHDQVEMKWVELSPAGD